MNPARPRLSGFVIITVALLLVGLGVVWSVASRANADEAQESRVKKLLEERVEIATILANHMNELFKAGKANFADAVEAEMAANNARLELCESKEERIRILEKNLERAKELQARTQSVAKAGVAGYSEVLTAKMNRLEAELALERAKLAN